MSDIATKTFSEVTIEAVITRADGKVENLGIIANMKKPLLKKIIEKIARRV